jgi:glycyl-tRNA synthetase beta subunit
VELRPALSRFFELVLIMHPRKDLRDERLDLIKRTATMIEDVADLREISISREDMQKSLAQLQTGR